MQTDNTLGLSTTAFLQREDKQLKEAAFKAKPKQLLSANEPLVLTAESLLLLAMRLRSGRKDKLKSCSSLMSTHLSPKRSNNTSSNALEALISLQSANLKPALTSQALRSTRILQKKISKLSTSESSSR